MPDLVVLDLGLPDADGMEFICTVRTENTVPILVLSARIDERDKVLALDLGANDYITKPFGTGELLARVRAALRTSRKGIQASTPGGTFLLEDLIIDYDRRQVSVSGNIIHLTQTEYNILYYLSQHAGKVMTYSAIIQAVWGIMDSGSIKKLQVNMANIRKKMGILPGENRYVVNELGVGYRMMNAQD
jgi:two-component system KDP operon response regulator KdpE